MHCLETQVSWGFLKEQELIFIFSVCYQFLIIGYSELWALLRFS